MRVKEENLVIVFVASFLIAAGGFFAVRLAFSRMLVQDALAEKAEPELGEIARENVASIVDRFNNELASATVWTMPLAMDEVLEMTDLEYRYVLQDDVVLTVAPESMSGEREQDAVLTAAISVQPESINLELAREYWYYLIKANDETLNDEQILRLMSEAENLQELGEAANTGNGLLVRVGLNGDAVEYCIERLYAELPVTEAVTSGESEETDGAGDESDSEGGEGES